MPDYRVDFPDGQAWNINVKAKKGEDLARTAHTRAVGARMAEGITGGEEFDDCTVRKLTAKLRAELKGLTYLDSTRMLATCISIGQKYQRQNLALTVRGMYYQLVSKGYLPSGQTEYNRVKGLLAKSRLRGTFPLGLLSDSSRTLHVGDATRYDLDVQHALGQALDWIPKLDQFFVSAAKWYRQPNLPIVLFEKEALSNVFGPTCRELGVSWMATKGNPSFSTLYELHQLMARSCDPRILEWDLDDLGYGHLQDLDPEKKTGDMSEYEQMLEGHGEAMSELGYRLGDEGYWTEENEEDDGPQEHDGHTRYRYRYGDLTATELHQGTVQTLRLLYFGDHDPDGIDIPKDLERRIRIIQIRTGQIIPFTIERLGLNRDQILRYNPPPFKAKDSSARYAAYAREHAWAQDRAWELDALDPTVLRDLCRTGVEDYFDDDIHDTVQAHVAEARVRFNAEMQGTVLPSLIKP